MMAEFPFSYKMTNNDVFPIVVGLDNRLHCNKTGLQHHLRRSYNYCEADAGEMSEEIVEFLNMSSEGIKSSRFASRREVHDFLKIIMSRCAPGMCALTARCGEKDRSLLSYLIEFWTVSKVFEVMLNYVPCLHRECNGTTSCSCRSKTILMRACLTGSKDAASILMQSVDTDLWYKLLQEKNVLDDQSCLHSAIGRGHIDVAKLIHSSLTAEQWYDLLNMKSHNGELPLHTAAQRGHVDVVKLVNSSVSAEQWCDWLRSKDRGGWTSLHHAVRRSHAEVVRLIKGSVNSEQWHDLLIMKNDEGSTPLHHTAYGDHRVVMEKRDMTAMQWYGLLNTTDNEGRTLLHYAADLGNTEILKIMNRLLTAEQWYSLLIKVENYRGTPLHLAARAGYTETVKMINTSVTDEQWFHLLLLQDNCGATPLFYAAFEGYPEMVTLINASLTREQCYELLGLQSGRLDSTVLHAVATEPDDLSDVIQPLLYSLTGHQLDSVLQAEDFARRNPLQAFAAKAISSPVGKF